MTILPHGAPEYTLFRSSIEALTQRTAEGQPYWSARDLMAFLEYSTWQKFEALIAKATESVIEAGLTPEHHFNPTVKKVRIGAGAQRDVLDYRVSRLGCYHLAMMADAAKPQAAFGRLYFSAQTHAAEIAQAQALTDEEDPVLAQLQALARVRREQIALERRVAANEQQLALTQAVIQEAQIVIDERPITGSQPNAIKSRVARLAALMGGQPPHYSEAWRRFKTRFDIASYRDLPARLFDDAVRFLDMQIASYGSGDLFGGEA